MCIMKHKTMAGACTPHNTVDTAEYSGIPVLTTLITVCSVSLTQHKHKSATSYHHL